MKMPDFANMCIEMCRDHAGEDEEGVDLEIDFRSFACMHTHSTSTICINQTPEAL